MTWDDTRGAVGDGTLMGEMQMVRRAGVRQWRSGVRSWRLHSCCRCCLPIWPGTRHHHITLGDGRERRIHYARCPAEQMTASDWFLVAFSWTFGLAVLWVLFGALGYQW